MTTIDSAEYFIGDELEPLQIWWYGNQSTLVDFSEPHTYALKVASVSTPTTTEFTKTSGIVGAIGTGNERSGTPNLTVNWVSTGELNALTSEGRYICEITATRTSDSLQRTGRVYMNMRARLT